jgi:hypothetical protein
MMRCEMHTAIALAEEIGLRSFEDHRSDVFDLEAGRIWSTTVGGVEMCERERWWPSS